VSTAAEKGEVILEPIKAISSKLHVVTQESVIVLRHAPLQDNFALAQPELALAAQRAGPCSPTWLAQKLRRLLCEEAINTWLVAQGENPLRRDSA
jgi:hypothetical protein